MFKVGDKVRRIGHSSPLFERGQVYTVSGIHPAGKLVYTAEGEGNAKNFELVKDEPMKTPHVHAEVIRAWADGAVIQRYNEETSLWLEATNPAFLPNMKYRVKPEPKPDVVMTGYISRSRYSAAQLSVAPWGSNVANLKLTFDGETGKLKSAEVL